MARRRSPDPARVEPLLAVIRERSAEVTRTEAIAAEARAARDEAIRAALDDDYPPTHAQVAEASGLARGTVGQI